MLLETDVIPNTRQDIQREIIIHRQLQHENVLRLIGVYYEEEGGPPLMVMPYLEHRSSSTFMETYGDAETYIHLVRRDLST